VIPRYYCSRHLNDILSVPSHNYLGLSMLEMEYTSYTQEQKSSSILGQGLLYEMAVDFRLSVYVTRQQIGDQLIQKC
jgi:hypothetical protein